MDCSSAAQSPRQSQWLRSLQMSTIRRSVSGATPWAIQTQYWPVPVYIVANSLTGVMVHAFLIHRVYSLCLDRRRSYLETDNDEDVLQKNQLVCALSCAILAVQTGSTTSTAAVATMVSYYILKNNSNVATAIYYLIGPLYLLTLLYNFNLRQYRDRIDINVSGSTDTRLTGPDAISMDAIHFHRTAIVSIDLPDGDASRSRVDTATKLSQYTEGGSFAAKGGRAGRADL
ncbi:hypothetical protein B0H14DRAFT_707609 [Mycena olivaceomarginata]|nr:hypothetical protein B0H14DRAFT_707609 [Mycena olivaceomarginata]